MRADWLFDHGGGGRGKFIGTNNCSSRGENQNNLVTFYMAKALKNMKKYKAKAKDYFHSKNESENFNFEMLDIGGYSESELEHG